jgi:hypothetical protein
MTHDNSAHAVCGGVVGGCDAQRVEDLYLDVRDVLHLLACFLARAVVDECVPPAFLLRQDLV